MKGPRNIPASVRQRLLNRARNDGRPFSELLQYYAMERFLYRLSRSVHRNLFILKGALMLRVWHSPEFRPTMDIDMLGRTSNDEENLAAQLRDILTVDIDPDGLIFDPDSIRTERITEDADYQGLRIRFSGLLDTAKITMQIDISFGDIIHPEPQYADLPTLLDQPAPRLLCYSRESAIAEKFQAMVHLGALNSRVKDFYDIWLLSRQFNFSGAVLTHALRLTFSQRNTPLPDKIDAFGESFIRSRQTQWTAFRRRLLQDHVPDSFENIVSAVELFLGPPISALRLDRDVTGTWEAPGPWSVSPGDADPDNAHLRTSFH